MREYTCQITIVNPGLPAQATLKVLRLPTSWHSVIWQNSANYLSFGQNRTERNGGFEHLDDHEFLCRVRLVANFCEGIDFRFENDFDFEFEVVESNTD